MKLNLPFWTTIFVLANALPVYAKCVGTPHLDPDDPPQKLSEAGLFEDLTTLKPCPSVMEYQVNASFWSDGATKRRWMALPPGTAKIQFTPEDPWKFPDNTLLVKHFELKTDSNQNTRIETRLLIQLAEDEWSGFSYLWQDDQKDAVLLDDSFTKEYLVYDPQNAGVKKKQSWWFPSQRACQECHNPWSGGILGLRTEQINGPADKSGKNQLDAWNDLELFSEKIEKASQYKSYLRLSSQTGTLESRVRSYLAVNCAQCHQPDSPVRSKMDLRSKIALEAMHLIRQKPNAGDLGNPNALLVDPGKKESSILWLRLKHTGSLRMPPIGSTELDTEAIEAVGAWIDQMKPARK